MPNAVRRIGLGTVFALLAGTLLLGHALKAPCASGEWGDHRQYTRLCYSDNVHQLATEQLGEGRLPYLDACIDAPGECDEYPVLTMWAMRSAAWISGSSTTGYFYSSAIMLWIAAFVIALCLYLLVGDRVLYFALAPTLALYATMNWDLLAVAFATIGTLAYLRRKDGWSGVLLGLGAAAKLFPLLLVIPFVVGRFRGKEPDRGIRLAWAAIGAWVAVNLPFALAAPLAWWEFFRYNAARLADWDSLWYLACERTTGQTCVNTRLVNVASLGLFVGWVAVVWVLKARREPGFPRWTLGLSDPGDLPPDQQGLLAAVQPVAAPLVRARVPPTRMVRRVRGRGRSGVRDALLVVRPLHRHRRRVRGATRRRLRARDRDPRAHPHLVCDRMDQEPFNPPDARRADGGGIGPREGHDLMRSRPLRCRARPAAARGRRDHRG